MSLTINFLVLRARRCKGTQPNRFLTSNLTAGVAKPFTFVSEEAQFVKVELRDAGILVMEAGKRRFVPSLVMVQRV